MAKLYFKKLIEISSVNGHRFQKPLFWVDEASKRIYP